MMAGTTAGMSQRPRLSQKGIGQWNRGAQHQRQGDDEQAGNEDVRVRVGDAAEDGVVLGEQIEAAEVDAPGDDQQDKRKCDGEAAPRYQVVAVGVTLKRSRAALISRKKPAMAKLSSTITSSQPESAFRAGSVNK